MAILDDSFRADRAGRPAPVPAAVPAAVRDPERLAALRRAALLDTPAEEAFDRLTQLAARVLRAPVALVSLVDADRQFFKSQVGLPEPWATRRETPLSHSFCQYAVASGQPLVVDDARRHPALRDNPAVPDLGFRAYAGIPLTTPEGHALGSYCVVDSRPRHWTDDEIDTLRGLAASVMAEVALRTANSQALAAADALRVHTETLETINRIGRLLSAELDLHRLVQAMTDAATTLTGAEFGSFFYNMTNARGEQYTLYTLSGAPRERFASFPIPRNTPLFGPTFRGERAVRIADVRQHPSHGQNPPYNGLPAGHLPVVSYLAVPVVSRSGEVLGGLFFGHSRAGVFTEQAEQIVVGLAAQTAVAMDNARLFEAEQIARQAAEAAVERTGRLQAVTASLSHAATPAGVAQTIIREGYPAVGAAGGLVVMLDETGSELELIGAEGYLPAQLDPWRRFSTAVRMPTADALRTGEPLFLESGEEVGERYPQLPTLKADRVIGALAALPLVVEDRPVGAISLRFLESRTFAAEDRAFLRALADQCAVALDRARLFRAEQEARSASEAAVRTRDEFLSVAAHELKTPITSLLATAQVSLARMAREGTLDAERTRAAMRTIEQQSRKLGTLVGQLLDVSRLETGRLTLDRREVDLVSLVRAAVAQAQTTTERHRIALGAGESLPAIVDPLRLEQVLNNLLDNAVKYSPDGGDIDVAVEPLDRSQPPAVRIAVRDRGLGIPPEHRERIFDRFYQVHAKSHLSGLGLGLHIAHQIVELHEGSIAVEAPPDGGSRFVVTLPVGVPGAG